MYVFVYHTDYDRLIESQSLLKVKVNEIESSILNHYMIKLKWALVQFAIL